MTLPSGQISLLSATTLWILSGLGLLAASFLLNPLCFSLSPVALGMICFYSLTKRFTDYTHVFLGLSLALAPVSEAVASHENRAACATAPVESRAASAESPSSIRMRLA